MRPSRLFLLVICMLSLSASPARADNGAEAERIAATAVRNALPKQSASWSAVCKASNYSTLPPKPADNAGSTMTRRYKFDLSCTLPPTTTPKAQTPAGCSVGLVVVSATPGLITTGKVSYRYKAACTVRLVSGKVLYGSASYISTAH